MKIVVVSDFAFVNGGASKIALGSAIGLAEAGHRVILLSAVGPIEADVSNHPGIQSICLEQMDVLGDTNRLRAAFQGVWNKRAKEAIEGILREQDPSDTLVHIHMWTKALTSSVVRASVDLDFKVVLTLHDYFAACPTGTFYNHNTQAICHLRPMSASCVFCNCDSRSYGHKLWRIGRQWVQHHIGEVPSEALDYISISHLSEEVLRRYLPEPLRIHRVSNFVDVQRREIVDSSRNSLFTFSGRLSAEKGCLLFARSSKQVGISTLFIGDGPLRSEIEAILPDSCITGWLSAEAAILELRRSRVLVFPSLWYETQGLVVAEALGSGIPVIVPDNSAAREWVQDGVTGLIFRSGDENDLSLKMLQLRDDCDLVTKLGRAAYTRYWRSPPTRRKHIERLESVYAQILRR